MSPCQVFDIGANPTRWDCVHEGMCTYVYTAVRPSASSVYWPIFGHTDHMWYGTDLGRIELIFSSRM